MYHVYIYIHILYAYYMYYSMTMYDILLEIGILKDMSVPNGLRFHGGLNWIDF